MAMSIVAVVVGKLWDMAANEAELLGGVKEQVERMERELKRIQCCLKDADSKRRRGDERAENWLNELRDVAYRIDDAVDTFHLELTDYCKKDRSWWDKIKKLGHKAKELQLVHNLGEELAKIQKVLGEISDSKNAYGIAPLKDQEDGGSTDTIIMPKRRTAYQDVDETEIVGLESDKNNILNLLCPEKIAGRAKKIARRAVITIVGAGGLGKTTLARMVYKSAKVNFEFHIMLSVSQQFSLLDLARKMLSELKESKSEKKLGNYAISARRLIRLWVAEKLIPCDEKKTTELKAEECLEQLVHRCMIQVSSRHSIGSIKSCRLHDLLRDLGPMHHAEKENFVTVFPKPQGVNHPHRLVRRASLQSNDYTNPWKGLSSNAVLTNLQNLGWVTGEHAWRNQHPCLKNLRKLKFNNGALREPRIDWDVVGHLLETLPYLQTLEIAAGYEIPKEIVYPRGLPNYQNLQTLYLRGGLGVNKIEASSFPEYLVKLTLIESNLKEDPMPELGRLKNLQKLQLRGDVCKSEMICTVGFPVLQTLILFQLKVPSLTIMEGVMPMLKHLTKENQRKITIKLPRELSHLLT
ncbi:Disease resistance protein (CC-NBS-LRR class) family [Rhynchospora pubera]|uniref:Disease resistance protein (CC-NBS-LRR class) family n=1 Tax=Rhynchospora pubera TaxID=906938 RepID=A0AAV8H6D0_9POAL|nr:Disease resistance protein (CC-NBS-LRR class) family [Rhynchospora pubera]